MRARIQPTTIDAEFTSARRVCRRPGKVRVRERFFRKMSTEHGRGWMPIWETMKMVLDEKILWNEKLWK